MKHAYLDGVVLKRAAAITCGGKRDRERCALQELSTLHEMLPDDE